MASAGQNAWWTMETVHIVNKSHKTRSWNQIASVLDRKQPSHKSRMLSCEPLLTSMTTTQLFTLQEEVLKCVQHTLSASMTVANTRSWICFANSVDLLYDESGPQTAAIFAMNLCKTDDLCRNDSVWLKPSLWTICCAPKEWKTKNQCDLAIVHLTCCTAPMTKRASSMTMQEQKKLSPSAL